MLELSNWKTYNSDGPNFRVFMNGFLWLNGEYIDLGPDGDSSTSFRKAKSND